MRISSTALALLVAGCGQAPDKTQPAPVATGGAKAAADDDGIACAVGGGVFARGCTVERTESPRGTVLTIRHPDGGFRRLLVTDDGRGVAAADGAQPAKVTLVGRDEIEVAIGGDRYRLPATVRAR